MGTPCDPLFLALPLLVAARQQVTCTTVVLRRVHGGHNVDVVWGTGGGGVCRGRGWGGGVK